MRWIVLTLNMLATAAFIALAAGLTAAQRTSAYSTYRELVFNRAIVEKPTYANNGEPLDVEARFRGLGSGMSLQVLGYLAGGACLLNGFVFFFSHRRNAKIHDD